MDRRDGIGNARVKENGFSSEVLYMFCCVGSFSWFGVFRRSSSDEIPGPAKAPASVGTFPALRPLRSFQFQALLIPDGPQKKTDALI